jgi:hypothetical protein
LSLFGAVNVAGTPVGGGRGPGSGAEHAAAIGPARENAAVDLARIGWLATALASLVAVLILVLQGYYGYAGVTFAVALSAAINLT